MQNSFSEKMLEVFFHILKWADGHRQEIEVQEEKEAGILVLNINKDYKVDFRIPVILEAHK